MLPFSFAQTGYQILEVTGLAGPQKSAYNRTTICQARNDCSSEVQVPTGCRETKFFLAASFDLQ
jgi:hypothetical protein